MTERVARLRDGSLETKPWLSLERARLLTEFYRTSDAALSIPVRRALWLAYLMERKTIYIGSEELIVGERGPAPKGTPSYPELCCHSMQDLEILHTREKISYVVSDEARRIQAEEVIPYWQGGSMRDRIFREMTPEWKDAYTAGIFTEFMEQRAPGHTVLGDVIYRKGLLELQADLDAALGRLDWNGDPRAWDRQQELKAMRLAAGAVMRFAERHADLALRMADEEADPQRQAELTRIAEVCRRVPARAPRYFHEALQAYWFVHLGVITELNTWDSFSPGRLDQHLAPFYERGVSSGTLHREAARELLQCFWVKFNNQPAPPKVGVTAAESGTYTDFCNINTGGLKSDGSDGVGDVTWLILDVIDEMRLLQPSSNLQLSKKSPDRFLKRGLEIVRQGWGQPSIFNADMVVEELLGQGKSIEDARAGGISGCVETGAFGKEAYILTGYFNTTKVLEITLANGFDRRTGRVRLLRRVVPGVPPSVAPLHRHQDSRQQRDRAAVRPIYAGAVPLRAGGRLHRQRARLPRWRPALQHHLHHGDIAGLRHRQPLGHPVSRVRPAHRRHGRAAAGAGRRFCRLREAAPSVVEQDAEIRQRRRLRGRYPAGGVRRFLRRNQRPSQHQGRRLSRQLSLHHVPCVFRIGDRGHAGWTARVGTAQRRHFAHPGRGPARAHRGDPVGGQAGSRAHGRDAAQSEVLPAASRGRERAGPSGAPGARVFQARRAPHPVQHRDRGDLAGSATRAAETPRSDRARGRVQRLLLRFDAGTTGRDYRADRAVGVLAAYHSQTGLPSGPGSDRNRAQRATR